MEELLKKGNSTGCFAYRLDINLVEWPDRLVDLPSNYLKVTVSLAETTNKGYIEDEDTRYIVLEAVGPSWVDRIQKIMTAYNRS